MEMPTLIPIGTLGETEEAYCFDRTSPWYGWLFHKNQDGIWVEWRTAGPNEREQIEESYRRKAKVN